MTTKGLPEIQSHVNREGWAEVSVRNCSLARNAVLADGDDLGAESVVLSSAVFVENVGGHGNQGYAGADLASEVSAKTASTVLPEELASRSWVSESEDGAIGVGARDNVRALGGGSSRGSEGQHRGGGGE